jgi:hypothetical protein
MSEWDDRSDRRQFLLRLVRSTAAVAVGATLLGGGCKCDDAEPDWADKEEEGDTQPGPDEQPDEQPSGQPPPDDSKDDQPGKPDEAS